MCDRPSRFRIVLYFAFAWAVSIVCDLSLRLSTLCFVDIRPEAQLSFQVAVICLVLSVLKYGSGAFVLGTLRCGHMNKWASAVIYVLPGFLLKCLFFALASWSESVRSELLDNAGNMIIMPVLCLAISPFASRYFIEAGEGYADDFSRQNAALNIPWFHWLWLLPFCLFQIVGVFSFLFLLLWYADGFIENFQSLPSFFSALVLRLLLLPSIGGIGLIMKYLYLILSGREESSRGYKVRLSVGVWLLITAIYALILFGVSRWQME